MYIGNIWGIFFIFYFTTLVAVYVAYRVGFEEGKKKYFSSFKRRKGENRYGRGKTKR